MNAIYLFDKWLDGDLFGSAARDAKLGGVLRLRCAALTLTQREPLFGMNCQRLLCEQRDEATVAPVCCDCDSFFLQVEARRDRHAGPKLCGESIALA